MKGTEPGDIVKIGSHVIVQRLDFKKVYRVSETGSLNLGKEEIKMNEIIGKPFWTSFKIIASQEKRDKRQKRNPPSSLIVAEKSESLLEDLKNTVTSGFDNRSIFDDGKSQKLSKEDILGLRDAGKSGREIVCSLMENNVSFAEKTEYSQEKYIKKKEKKYCQFLSIHKPNLNSLLEIYLRQDASKIYHMRMDTLAQIYSYGDVKSDATYILYDSGTSGLIPAGMLSRMGANTTGSLIYLHSGDHLPQMPITRAMNFPQEQFDKMIISSIFDFLKAYHNKDKVENDFVKNVTNIYVEKEENTEETENNCDKVKGSKNIEYNDTESNENNANTDNPLKRKRIEQLPVQGPAMKKSRKVLDVERAVSILSDTKADSLIIIAKEHPLNILTELLTFVNASRPFVVYHANRELLEETYVALKQRNDVVNIKLFQNFLRSYQVLPDRTHPEIMTNDCGGYILTGYTVI